MITVADFRKLLDLEQKDYHIFIDGDEICGLMYDEDIDPEEFVDGNEEMRCTFSWVDDKYGIICYLEEHKKCNWTVEKPSEEVDWRSFGGPL